MPSDRPSLLDIRSRVSADFLQHSNGDVNSPGSLEYTVANVITGVAHSLYGRIEYMQKQSFDFSAEDEFVLRRAADYGLFLIAGFKASGSAKFKGINGAVVAMGVIVESGEWQFVTTSAGTVVAGEVVVAIKALKLGVGGNLAAGTALSLVNSVSNVEPQAEVVSLAGGADTETIARFKERFAERKAKPPAGGNDHDYIAWAKQAHPDVTRVWVIRNGNGIGTVAIYIMCDGLSNGLPTQPIIDAVTDYIDQPDVRPSAMKGFSVEAPDLLPVDITVLGLAPNTTAIQNAVQAELGDYIASVELGGTVYLHRLREAFSTTAGVTDFRIDLTDNVVPAVDQLPVLGVITWPGV